MKKLIFTSVLALLLAGVGTIKAQEWPEEYLGLPGDNLNLYAVMDLFQQSETLEGFEKELNAENSRINNLDLNGDNLVDYIMVSDYVDGNVHNIVLRVALNQNDYQDVAVFTVQKFNNGEVQVQLIGDEALYGRNYIIEPNYAETPNPGYTGRVRSRANVTLVTTSYYDLAYWPVIRYIYMPDYIMWHSSWYWGYWPAYWYSWTPYYWHYYYGYHHNWYDHYYAYYRHCDHYRYNRYNDFYFHNVRAHSPLVAININNGHYKNTYSRPESRRDGEALGAKAYSERSSRMQNNTNVSRVDRRTTNNQSTGDQGRLTTSSNTERRTAGTINNGSRTYSSSGRSTGTTSRSTTTGAYKSDRSSSTGRTIETTRRSTPTVTNKSMGSSSTSRSSGSTYRTTPTVSNKSTGSSSTSRSSGSTYRSTPTVTNKSTGSSTVSRSSGSSHKSTPSRSSSGSSGSQRTSSSRPSR